MMSSNRIVLLIALPPMIGAASMYVKKVERSAIFRPIRGINTYPDKAGLDFEDVCFESRDGLKLNGWFIPAGGARYTVLFCHGNTGNMSHRIKKAVFFNKLGYNVFMFDYRGYGNSKGSPSEGGLYKDTKAAYDYLRERGIAADAIVGYGESLGGAALIDLARDNEMRGLILESAFSNAKDIAKALYPYAPSWFISSKFDSAEKIKSIKTPKLMIHSANDNIVPFGLGEKLFRAAAEPKTMLRIRGEHNACFFVSQDALQNGIMEFLK